MVTGRGSSNLSRAHGAKMLGKIGGVKPVAVRLLDSGRTTGLPRFINWKPNSGCLHWQTARVRPGIEIASHIAYERPAPPIASGTALVATLRSLLTTRDLVRTGSHQAPRSPFIRCLLEHCLLLFVESAISFF